MSEIEIGTVLTLVLVSLIDSMLSVDNALVLAVVVEHLPPHLRVRALRFGIVGAYISRALSIFLISFLVSFWPLKLIGALYLLWLGGSHIIRREAEEDDSKPRRRQAGFGLTILQVLWLDLTFSLDNILATVALAPNNVAIVIIGVAVSMVALALVAGVFLRLLSRFPILRTTAYILVTFIGVKLLLSLVGIEIQSIETFVLIMSIVVISIVYERAKLFLASRQSKQESSDVVNDDL